MRNKIEYIDLGTSRAAFVNSTEYTRMDKITKQLIEEDSLKVIPYKETNGYVSWGDDNKYPYQVIDAMRNSVVMAQNKYFNTKTCYASGLRWKNTDKAKQAEINRWFLYHRPVHYLMEQACDVKNWMQTACVIILNKDRTQINKLQHLDMINCRIEKQDDKGKINYVFYTDFNQDNPEAPEIIPLLDIYNPIEDLECRMGRTADPNKKYQEDKHTKYVLLNRFPTVGERYYPFHPSWSVFLSGWFKYSQLIPLKKTAKLENNTPVKYLVEIHDKYWEEDFKLRGITSDKDKIKRMTEIKDDIKKYLTGIENSNKMWVSGFYIGPDGKESSYIKISIIDTSKEGGELIDDSLEATNYLCYADGVHPSMIGANPGKSDGASSGSVQRELYTMKQALEKPYHDILLEPYEIVKHINGWDCLELDIPVVTLTTLDKGKDAEENTLRNNDLNNN